MLTTPPLSIVCWKWKPTDGYTRGTFGPEHVHTLRAMVRRHYSDPHRFICITDDAEGLAGGDIEIVPLWEDHRDIPHPHNTNHPSCYRRLKVFSTEMRRVLGPRFVSVDLDCVITGDVRPLWNRQEEFVGWGRTHSKTPYNGSMFMMTAGARERVWTEFNPPWSQKHARDRGFYGSDQAWMSFVLGPDEARWTDADGVYSYRVHLAPNAGELPPNGKIVFFNGGIKPWDDQVQNLEWIRKHYR